MLSNTRHVCLPVRLIQVYLVITLKTNIIFPFIVKFLFSILVEVCIFNVTGSPRETTIQTVYSQLKVLFQLAGTTLRCSGPPYNIECPGYRVSESRNPVLESQITQQLPGGV